MNDKIEELREYLKENECEDMVIGMDDDGEWINATDMMLKYHQEQLKLLNIDFVSEPFCKCAEPKIYYTRVMNCEACENCGKEVYVR